MATAQYRLSSNEVTKISLQDQSFDLRDLLFWGILIDPSLPDGSNTVDVSGVLPGPLRILGFAKIAIPATNTIRNATQAEIDSFEAFELSDEMDEEELSSKDLFDNHWRFRRIFIAMADIIMGDINILRQQHGLSDRTLPQFRTAMRNRINRDD